MRVIAFDIGANLAVAHNLGAIPHVQHETFDGIRAHRAGATLLFLHRLFREIKANKAFGKPDAVVYEQPFARGEAATRSLWGIAGLIEATATNAGFGVVSVTPTEIKKFACGKGKAEKDEMISAAHMLGYEGANEHEADAWCLLHYAEVNLEAGGSE